MSNTLTANGIREIGFSLEDDAIEQLKQLWFDKNEKCPDYPDGFEGKGIVICAGGLRLFPCAWVLINKLRQLGCTLPIELWYIANELSLEVISELENLGVTCNNFWDHKLFLTEGFIVKPTAIIKSKFEQILYLDADNNLLKDPSGLFETKEFKKYGAIFWPDYWKTSSENPIWKIVDDYDDSFEQDSGQLLIDKRRCWKELNICLHFNQNPQFYYSLLYGDKDTFRFAWKALKTPYFMITKEVASCGFYTAQKQFNGVTMVQHDLDNQIMFLHRNLIKWDVTKPDEKVWQVIKSFSVDANNKTYKIDYSNDSNFYVDITGDIEEADFEKQFGNYEGECLDILNSLRSSAFFSRFMTFSHLSKNRFHNSRFDGVYGH